MFVKGSNDISASKFWHLINFFFIIQTKLVLQVEIFNFKQNIVFPQFVCVFRALNVTVQILLHMI